MSKETFDNIIDGAKNNDSVETLFFGGVAEPFTHPDLLVMIKDAKLTGKKVELITNGFYLNKEVIDKLLQMELDMLWVSLDGADADSYETVRPDGDYNNITTQLLRFSRTRIRGGYQTKLGMAFVAMKSNIHQLPKIIELANFLKVSELKVTNILPYDQDMGKEILYKQRLYDLCFKEKKPPSSKGNVATIKLPVMDFGHPNVLSVIPEVFSLARQLQIGSYEVTRQGDYCDFVENNSLFVRWDGEVCPCMSLLHNHYEYLQDTKRKIYHCSFGNVNQISLQAIWTSVEYRLFRERIHNFSFPHCTICGHCSYVEENKEDCVGNRFPTCGGCLWAEGFIQCP